jgi:hypothetical protein
MMGWLVSMTTASGPFCSEWMRILGSLDPELPLSIAGCRGVNSKEQREQSSTDKQEIPPQRNFIIDQSVLADRPIENLAHAIRLLAPELRDSHSEFFGPPTYA